MLFLHLNGHCLDWGFPVAVSIQLQCMPWGGLDARCVRVAKWRPFFLEIDMINSRKLEDLHPLVQAKARLMIEKCRQAGIDLMVTSTYRDLASQDALYAQGRTVPGNRVTNARAGQSFHNYRVAFDVVPVINGKPCWDTSGPSGQMWQQVGAIGKSCGLQWAGDWKTFPEFPHFQYTAGLTLKDFQAGRTLP